MRDSLSAGVALKTSWKASTACKNMPKGCWEASLAGQGVGGMTGLRLDGRRAIRARYPNFDEELDRVIDGKYLVHDGHVGWIGSPTDWVSSGDHGMNGIKGPWPPTEEATTHVIDSSDWPSVDWPMHIMTNGSIDPSSWTGEGGWGQYWIGVGGTCIDRDPQAGYWCAPGAPRRISTPNHPVGIRPTSAQLPHLPYTNATGAVVHSWRPGHWYTNMYLVGESDASQLNFSKGGFQGGEGVTGGEVRHHVGVVEACRSSGVSVWADPGCCLGRRGTSKTFLRSLTLLTSGSSTHWPKSSSSRRTALPARHHPRRALSPPVSMC